MGGFGPPLVAIGAIHKEKGLSSVEKKDLESWQNMSRGTHFIRRLDHRGELTRVEGVDPGKVVHISPEERRINSEQAASEDLDVFRNGIFHAVRLIEDNEEAREIAANPNAMSESDMVALVKGHPKTFTARLNGITNQVTLERLLQTAMNEDAPVRRVEAIKEKIAAQDLTGPRPGGPVTGRAVTPR